MAELRVLTATAPCTGLRAVAEACGEPVGQRELARRVGHLTALIQSMAACVVTAHWNGEDLDRLASGRSADGRTLPSKGWMALRRLGWAAAARTGWWWTVSVSRPRCCGCNSR
ncbi:hypothetical protein [Planomonospora algeriensis]